MSNDGKTKIRIGVDGILMLLACRSGKGKLALGKQKCDFERFHIAIKTDNFQHPDCIDLLLQTRYFVNYTNTDTSKYSRCYKVSRGVGSFDVLLRWQSGHDPYPQIKNLEVWCFGIYMGNRAYPKANDSYVKVASVTVKSTGQVVVNGRNAGFWTELLMTEPLM